jgi:hypothetical protein
MFPSPFSVRAAREGRLIDMNIGVLALRLPGVVPITGLPDRTCVVIRSSRVAVGVHDDRRPGADVHGDVVVAGQIDAAERRKCEAASPRRPSLCPEGCLSC